MVYSVQDHEQLMADLGMGFHVFMVFMQESHEE